MASPRNKQSVCVMYSFERNELTRTGLYAAAQQVMRQLEQWRTANEQSRLVAMNQGMSRLLSSRELSSDQEQQNGSRATGSKSSYQPKSSFDTGMDCDDPGLHSQVSKLLNLATVILEESLDLRTGGIAFYDCSRKVSRRDSDCGEHPSLSVSSDDVADVLASVTIPPTQSEPLSPESRLLSSLLENYPSGTIWSANNQMQ